MARPWEHDWQRLPLEGTANTRELGGYPTSRGGQTAWRRFLRSDSLANATSSDLEFLEGYGLSAVLDLRGAKEATSSPDRLPDGVAYANVPLIGFNVAAKDRAAKLKEMGGLSIHFVYDLMFEAKAEVKAAMEFLADAPEGCVLFHCSVGKDRAGVIAALLMLLAGCDRQDVIASYVVSRINLMRLPWFVEAWERDATGPVPGAYDSRPDMIGHWLDRLVGEYGGVVPYLADCGVSYEGMERLRTRLLQ